MNRLLLALAALPLTACIWNPNSRSNQEATGTFTVSGYSPYANTNVTLTAPNHTTGAMGTLATVPSGNTIVFYGPDPFYAWSATITPAADYFAPQLSYNGLSHGPGRIEITAKSNGYSFYTFTAAAQTCTTNAINGGATIENAAQSCSDGMSLVLFDNNGVGNGPPTNNTWSTSWVTDCCNGTACAPGATSCNYTGPDQIPSGVTWEIGHYQSQNNMKIYGTLCHPSAAGTYKGMIINHGDFSYGDWALAACLDFANQGFVTAVSVYRGEEILLAGTPVNNQISDGVVELCQGEVIDSMQLLTLLRTRSDVNTSKIIMWGHSHGACITERAVAAGAQVQAAAAFSPPTDFYAWYNYCAPGSVCYQQGPTTQAGIATALGSTPTQSDFPYAWRSPYFATADLAARTDVKMLLMQGGSDWLIEPSQACELVSSGFGSASQNWHYAGTPYAITTTPPAGMDPSYQTGCGSYNLTWQPSTNTPPYGSWPGNRYFFVFEAENHISMVTNPTGLPWLTFNDWVLHVI